MIVKPVLKRWFAALYGRDQQSLLRVSGEYRALASSPLLLADLAARNFVYAVLPDEPQQMAIAEGRRRAALEVLQLANIDPRALADQVLKVATPDDNKR